MGSEFYIVGSSPPRVDGRDKVTGRAQYTGDLSLAGLLQGRILRSPYPHARIKSIDTAAAEALPGVVAVLTAADFPHLNRYFGHAVVDRPFIATGKVRHIGEPVAAVAAETEEIAADALALIEVEYEELPIVSEMEAALAPGAPLVHEEQRPTHPPFRDRAGAFPGGNVCYRHIEEKGDVAAALAGADFTFTDTFTFPSVYHYSMEPHAAVAEFRGDMLTVWTNGQHPFMVRKDLAGVFGLPLGQVRVIVPFVGGGFGGKSFTKIEPLAAALALKARRPVRLCLSVNEAFHTNRRHGAKVTMTTGVMKDGTLVARDIEVLLDTGGYADNGPATAGAAALRALGPYKWQAFRVVSTAVYTNHPPSGSMRNIGAPQGFWAGESHVDMIAHHLGQDPAVLRRRNLPERGGEFAPGYKSLDCDLQNDVRLLDEALNGPAPEPASADGKLRGRGLALAIGGGAPPVSVALVRLHADGHVTVLAGSSEIGQGARTVISQIAAEELRVPIASVTYAPGDTAYTPFDYSTGASRSTVVAGTAVQLACQDIKRQLLEIAAKAFGRPQSELRCDGGAVHGPDGASLSFADLVRKYFGSPVGELIGKGYCNPETTPQLFATWPMFWETALGGAEISVDPATGVIDVERFVCVSDVGRAIHPLMVRGQEQGAVVMGIGHTLFEEIEFEDGRVLNANLADYRVPLAGDIARSWESISVEDGTGPGPYGAKGAGETPVTVVAPAIANALFQATGARIKDLPLTPERVWRALREQSAEKK